MAANTFDALMAEVNGKISDADMAASQANAAAAAAGEAAKQAQQEAQQAQTAADGAQQAAQSAQETAQAWENARVSAATVAAGGAATVSLTESGGAKALTFGIPRGADGAQGPKGDTGRSGVTFSLSGTRLYITTG